MTKPVPLEQRQISEMSFGFNKCGLDPTLGEAESKAWQPSPEQEAEQTWVRGSLSDRGCVVASDIEKLGCTGVVRGNVVVAEDIGMSKEIAVADAISDGTRLRLGLAGSGVGLPCFVPPTRFCLIHNTIGGLEKRQVQRHAEFVYLISRPLTPEEEAKVAAMSKASTMKSVGELNDFIAGKTDVEAEEPEEEIPIVRPGERTWKCPEHSETVWSCRYCLAQAIVEGPLEPRFAYGPAAASPDGSAKLFAADAAGVVEEICAAQAADQDKLYIYAGAATFTRKLSRD